MPKVVKLEDFPKELKEFSRRMPIIYKVSVIKAVASSLKRLVRTSPIDTGLFAQSWDIIITEKSALLGNTAPHAPHIEFGARPFRPPLRPLLDWARRVLKRPTHDSDVWGLAKYTQAKIEKEGMKPKNILKNQLEEIVKDIRKNLKGAYERYNR